MMAGMVFNCPVILLLILSSLLIPACKQSHRPSLPTCLWQCLPQFLVKGQPLACGPAVCHRSPCAVWVDVLQRCGPLSEVFAHATS